MGRNAYILYFPNRFWERQVEQDKWFGCPFYFVNKYLNRYKYNVFKNKRGLLALQRSIAVFSLMLS